MVCRNTRPCFVLGEILKEVNKRLGRGFKEVVSPSGRGKAQKKRIYPKGGPVGEGEGMSRPSCLEKITTAQKALGGI